MRQRLGPKKTERLRRETGLPIAYVLVRGGTDHRRDLFLEDGSTASLFRDGELEVYDKAGNVIECRPAAQNVKNAPR